VGSVGTPIHDGSGDPEEGESCLKRNAGPLGSDLTTQDREGKRGPEETLTPQNEKRSAKKKLHREVIFGKTLAPSCAIDRFFGGGGEKKSNEQGPGAASVVTSKGGRALTGYPGRTKGEKKKITNQQQCNSSRKKFPESARISVESVDRG